MLSNERVVACKIPLKFYYNSTKRNSRINQPKSKTAVRYY